MRLGGAANAASSLTQASGGPAERRRDSGAAWLLDTVVLPSPLGSHLLNSHRPAGSSRMISRCVGRELLLSILMHCGIVSLSFPLGVCVQYTCALFVHIGRSSYNEDSQQLYLLL